MTCLPPYLPSHKMPQMRTTLIPTLKRLALESALELRTYAQLALSRLPYYALSFARAAAVASRSAITWGGLLLGRGASFAASVRNRREEGGRILLGRGARFPALIRNQDEKMRGGMGRQAGVYDSSEERREERRGRRRSGGLNRRRKGSAGATVKGIKGPRIAMIAQYSRSKKATTGAGGWHDDHRGGGREGWQGLGSKGDGAGRERYKGMLVDLVKSIDILLL